jgi:uncharacterized protein YkwD
MKILIIAILIFILLSTSAFTVEGLIDSINQVRIDNGLEQVQRFEPLYRLAEYRIAKMDFTDNSTAHKGVRADAYKIIGGNIGLLGEVVALTPKESMPDDRILTAWLNSPGHARVILNPNLKYIGGYMCQCFACTEYGWFGVVINFMGRYE